ncbi:unnamed protein product [Leptidea sinapis]|uniref:Peptidase S1 domain-containing protein n=1 Tax=Leptidea sinapis TaxID=189913 RepID=A0A5E4QTI8_9NEOP|nr:unnamed protein product [Leptidea sinapis]
MEFDCRILIMYLANNVGLVWPNRYFPDHELAHLHPFPDRESNTMFVNLTLIPHHVLIVYKGWYCSGSLTSSRIVITAASCFSRRKCEAVTVKVGAESMTANGQVIPVLDVKKHEYFQRISITDNDIALLILKEHVIFHEKVKKILYLDQDVVVPDNTPLCVIGWGGTDQPVRNLNMPLRSEMTVISRDDCMRLYGRLVTPSNFCVRYNTQHRLSDNGGSVIYQNWLVGVLSAGGTSTRTPNIAIVTNISYFNRWIHLNTVTLLRKYCTEDSMDNYSFISFEK